MATNKPKRNFFRKKGGYRRNEESGEEFFNLVKRQLDKRILVERYREVQRLKWEALLEGLAISSFSVLHLMGPSSDCGCGCESASDDDDDDDPEEVSEKPYGPLNQDVFRNQDASDEEAIEEELLRLTAYLEGKRNPLEKKSASRGCCDIAMNRKVETDLELICEHFMLPDSITVDEMRNALAEPDEPGDDPPLHIAVRDEDIDVVKALLNFGVDVNAKGQHGQTPIHAAAVVGSIPILELLVDRGGDLTMTNDNKLSALHIAVQQEWPRTTRWLLNKGLDINALDSTLSTPLHWAAFDGNIPMAKLLLGRGAKIDIRNDEGHTPFEIARAIGTRDHDIIANILRSRTPKNFYAQKKELVNQPHEK